jgi:hypothetical protein
MRQALLSAMICQPRANFIGDGRGGDMDYPYNLGPYSRKALIETVYFAGLRKLGVLEE